MITHSLLLRGVTFELSRIFGVILRENSPEALHCNRTLGGAPRSGKASFHTLLHITFSTFSCNQGTPHTRPGIYKSLGTRRSRCVRSRQLFLVSRVLVLIINVEMLTVKFCSICTSPWMLAFSFCTIIVFFHMFRRRRALPLPPGPKGLPILGNALDMPRENPWLTYWQWGKECSK